jgi:5'-nucleotidase
MSDAVDVVIAGHSHTRIDLRVPNRSGHGDKVVVESLAYGTAYDRVDLTVDRATGDVVAKDSAIVPTTHEGIPPDAQVAALVHRYRRRLGGLADRVVGHAAGTITAATGLGEIAARGQRALARTDLALVDTGSFRGYLHPGPVTYADLFQTQAYDHPLLRMKLRGRDVLGVLHSGEGGAIPTALCTAGLSGGSTAGGSGPLVLAGGRQLEPDKVYTVAANELLVGTGPFPALRRAARNARQVGDQVEALARYVESLRQPIRPTSPRQT